jgi:hypothetical protein
MKSIVCAAALAVLWSVIALVQANGQSEAASISGVVSDTNGNIIPGVTVAATNTDTKSIVNTMTNEAGKYGFSGLRPGTYDVLASLTGLNSTGVQKQLTSGESAQLNFKMIVAVINRPR